MAHQLRHGAAVLAGAVRRRPPGAPEHVSGRTRVPCIEQYVESHDTQLPVIPTALYEFDFVSPSWSPDLAGWTELAAIISSLIAVVTFIFRSLLRHASK